MTTRYRAYTGEPTHTGEGITRTTDPRARLWPVAVTFATGARPLRSLVRAVSSSQAKTFASARYPMARSITVGPRPSAVLP